MNLKPITATQTALSSTQTTLRIGEDMARRREEELAELANPEKRSRNETVKFEKERDAVQGAAYEMAKEQGASGSVRPLVERMDAIYDEEMKQASGPDADLLKMQRGKPTSLDQRSETFGNLLENGAILDPQRRRDGLIVYEAMRLTPHLRNPKIAELSRTFKNDSRGDNRRLNPERLRANLSAFLTGHVQSAKKHCIENKDKAGAMFTNAALKRLDGKHAKPASLRTLAVIADRTGRIVDKRHPGIATPLIAVQLTALEVDQVQRAKAKRQGLDQGA